MLGAGPSNQGGIPGRYHRSSSARREPRPPLHQGRRLLAGLDGIKRAIEPREPIDRDLYELGEDEAAGVPQVPGSLNLALDALENDHEFLLEGGVFTPDLIETWIDFKRTKEINAINLRPHPWEFFLYYDI